MINIPEGWSGDEKRISKLFTFADFTAALSFMFEVGFYCKQVDHHPEWKNIYNKVWVDLTTHSSGSVTDKDLALARHMDKVAGRFETAPP